MLWSEFHNSWYLKNHIKVLYVYNTFDFTGIFSGNLQKSLFFIKFKVFSKTLYFARCSMVFKDNCHESIWPMESFSSSSYKRWHIWLRFCPPESVILMWIKKLQQIHRKAYRTWNPLPIPFIWVLIEPIEPKLTLSRPIIQIIIIPQIATKVLPQSHLKWKF